MTNKNKMAIFEGKKIRRVWVEKEEKWYFSVVDIVQILSSQPNFTMARKYWNKLAQRLRDEGSEVVTKCHQLKMPAADGKMRPTDAADTEIVLRIIQTIPSPRAEPLKLWLARVGYERVQEADDPELAINRALRTYLRKGYSQSWINLRLKSIEIRKDLTNEWEIRGISADNEFAILTDDITFAWAGLKTRDYKNHKNLKTESLRDNMTNLELVLNMLAEGATTEISKSKKPKTFHQNRKVAKEGGSIAGRARRQIEKRSGKKVISSKKYEDTKKEISN